MTSFIRSLLVGVATMVVVGISMAFCVDWQRPALPSHVKIGAIDYKISYYKSAEDFGEIDYERGEIHIQEGLAYDFECEVLLHEIKHGEMFPALRSHGTKTDLKLSEDEFIEASAFAEVQVLRDNPQILKYLGATK